MRYLRTSAGPRALLASAVIATMAVVAWPGVALGAQDVSGQSGLAAETPITVHEKTSSTGGTGGGGVSPAPSGLRILADTASGPHADPAGVAGPDLRTNTFRHDDFNVGITTDDRINLSTGLFSPVPGLRDGDEIRYEFDLDNNPASGSATGSEVAVWIVGFAGFAEDVELRRWDATTGTWTFVEFLFRDVEFDTTAIDMWVRRDLLGIARGSTVGINVVTFNTAGFVDVAPNVEASYQLAIDATPLAPTAVVRGATASGTTTTATFGGEVNPGGIPTTYRFQYGTTPSYGSETTAASAGAVRTPVVVSQSVAGLTPGTTYHWRLVASSAAGEAFSPNQTLTTIPNPPTAGTGRGLATGPRSLRLTGTASTGGAAGTAFFEYGPTARFGLVTTPVAVNGAAAQVQIDLRGLRRDTVYFYRLVVDTAGGRGLGKNLSVRTGDQNQVIASIDAPIASVGSVFTVPRFRANVRILGPTGNSIRSSAALRRVQVHVLCTRGCRVNQRFSLRRSTVTLRSALGTGVPVAIRTTPRGATIDLSRLFAAYQFKAGAEIQLRLTGAGLRGSASVVTLKSVARRLRCALRNNRPVQCEIP